MKNLFCAIILYAFSIVFARSQLCETLIAEGRWYGRILTEGRGSGGFGYNPVFLPDGYEQSVAEMDDALKNRLSHRGQALVKLHERLRELRHA